MAGCREKEIISIFGIQELSILYNSFLIQLFLTSTTLFQLPTPYSRHYYFTVVHSVFSFPSPADSSGVVIQVSYACGHILKFI